MRKVKRVLLPVLILWLALICQSELLPLGKKTREEADRVGLNAVFNQVPVFAGDDNLENTLAFNYLALQIDVRLLNLLTIGVLVGYNSNTVEDPVDFLRLPLTLRTEGEMFRSMMFGFRGEADIFSRENVSITARTRLLFFETFRKERPIRLAVTSGNAVLENAFRQLEIELRVQYDCFKGFGIFAGPRLNIIAGHLTAAEAIEDIDARQKLSYRQQKAVGLSAGFYYRWGAHLKLSAAVFILSQTSISMTVFYVPYRK
jgi:hypothetical protein